MEIILILFLCVLFYHIGYSAKHKKISSYHPKEPTEPPDISWYG